MKAKSSSSRDDIELRDVYVGVQELAELRDAMTELFKAAGLSFVFHPASEPRLRDYLSAGVVGAAKGAAIGALVGGLLGLATGSKALLAAGTGIGLVIGVGVGTRRVDRGWRIYAGWSNGTPYARVSPLDSE